MCKRTRANICGNIAIILSILAFILTFHSVYISGEYKVGIVYVLMLIYIVLRDEYRKIRQEEIDELIQNKRNIRGMM